MTSERDLKARITAVFIVPEGAGATEAPMSHVKYSAVSVEPDDHSELANVSPFRRWIFNAASQEPNIKPAKVGDSCRIAVCQGETRLCDVPEQWIVGDCEPQA